MHMKGVTKQKDLCTVYQSISDSQGAKIIGNANGTNLLFVLLL